MTVQHPVEDTTEVVREAPYNGPDVVQYILKNRRAKVYKKTGTLWAPWPEVKYSRVQI